DLRPIMIGASARYAALSIKIPDVGAPTWKWAGDIINMSLKDQSSTSAPSKGF
ncbi:Hypothetical protein FKW44_002340, partial [Caligus rogercresseyi]